MVKLSQKNPYIADTIIAKNCYSGHIVLAPCEKFELNLPTLSEQPILFVGKWDKLLFDFQMFYLTYFSTFTFSEMSSFSEAGIKFHEFRE